MFAKTMRNEELDAELKILSALSDYWRAQLQAGNLRNVERPIGRDECERFGYHVLPIKDYNDVIATARQVFLQDFRHELQDVEISMTLMGMLQATGLVKIL